MKTAIHFIAMILYTLPLYSQIIGSWSSPTALTDSTSDNSNPVLIVWENEVYMIYNKYSEPNREIWWRKISEPMSEEEMLVGGWPEVDYRNPQIVNNFLVCEINLLGQYDLFGFRIDTSGLLDSGFQITNTEYDENAFNGYNSFYPGICCWESEGNIYVAEPQVIQDTLILADITLIDSVNCSDPVCLPGYVAWQKIENNESHIYYSENVWPNYQWSDPEIIVDTGNNINLSLSINVPEIGGEWYLWWEANNKIYFSDVFGGNWYYSPEIPGVENYHEPTAFEISYLTDNYYGVYSFVGETGTVSDIYIVDEQASNYILNITNDTNPDKNPRFFIGRKMYEYSNYYEILNIWQKEINGNDVLYFSSAWYNLVIGNVDDKEMIHVNIFPNPVSKGSSIQISFSESIAEDYSISILNNQGQKVDNIRVERKKSNIITINWEISDLLVGIYYLVIETKNETFVEKFIVL